MEICDTALSCSPFAPDRVLSEEAHELEKFWLETEGSLPPEYSTIGIDAKANGHNDVGLCFPFGFWDVLRGHRLAPTLQQRASLNAAVAFFSLRDLLHRQRGYLVSGARGTTRDGGAWDAGEMGLEAEALMNSSGWSCCVAGVVCLDGDPDGGEGVLTTDAGRREMSDQLQFAAFLGLRAVVVPLPTSARADGEEGVWKNSFEERRIVCLTSDLLLQFIQSSGHGTQVWVRCQAEKLWHRKVFHLLREAVLYGYDATHFVPLSRQTYTAASPCGENSHLEVRREAIGAVLPYLCFLEDTLSHPLSPLVSSVWLGEAVAGFELPL